MSYYLTHKQIQDYLNSYYDNHHTYLSFLAAVQQLYAKGKALDNPSSIALYNYDFSDIHQLSNTIETHTIDITPIISSTTSIFRTEDYFPFFKNDIVVTFPFCNTAPSFHQNEYFVTSYIIQGSYKIHSTDFSIEVHRGDFIVIPPNIPFDIFTDNRNSIAINMSIRKSTFESTFSHILKEDGAFSHFFWNSVIGFSESFFQLYIETKPYLLNLLKCIYIESSNYRNYSSCICANYTEIFFSELLRHYSGQHISIDNHHSVYTVMPLILTYMKNHFKTLTLTELATFFNYESNYLSKHIKHATGYTFKEIINNYKIEYAARLLITTSLSIEWISENAGYNSADHFSRVFRSIYHCSPSEYRKKQT